MYKLITVGTLLFCLLCNTAKAQVAQLPDLQTPDEDSLGNVDNAIPTHYSYQSYACFTGVGVKIPRTITGGTVSVSFPYTSTDAAGVTTNNVFQSSGKNTVYNNVKPYVTLFGLEAGGLKHFYSLDFSLGGDASIVGFNISTGYGFLWYFNGLGEHEKNVVNKRFVFKASVNVVWDLYSGSALLGTIDNANKTINILGYKANPTFDVASTDGDGNIETDTYSAQNLDILYTHTEWSLLPKISIGNNPYKSSKSRNTDNSFDHKKAKLLWDLSIGYNIPFYYKEGILLRQDDDNDNSEKVNNSLISLKTPSVNFMYNGKRTTSTPLRFSGLFVSLSFRIGISKYY